jgi:hypothetical protein
MSAVDAQQVRSSRSAATIYDADEKTLRRRRAGAIARRDCQPNSKKFIQIEGQVIVQHILDLDQRGLAPTYAAVRDMANKLLAARGVGQIRQKWPSIFVRRTESLKTRTTSPSSSFYQPLRRPSRNSSRQPIYSTFRGPGIVPLQQMSFYRS